MPLFYMHLFMQKNLIQFVIGMHRIIYKYPSEERKRPCFFRKMIHRDRVYAAFHASTLYTQDGNKLSEKAQQQQTGSCQPHPIYDLFPIHMEGVSRRLFHHRHRRLAEHDRNRCVLLFRHNRQHISQRIDGEKRIG